MLLDWTVHVLYHVPQVPSGNGVTGGPESVQYGWEAGRTDDQLVFDCVTNLNEA